MRTERLFALAVVSAMTLVACGGHSSVPGSPATPTASIPAYTGPQQLASFDWGKTLLQKATLVGKADTNATLAMEVTVKQRDGNGLLQYANSVSDPHSASYRHFLTPQEIGERFGASISDYQSTANYFKSNGIAVAGWPQRLILSATGTVGQFERAFNTTFGTYQLGMQQFIGPTGAPHLTTVQPIASVVGMVSVPLTHTYIIRPGNQLQRGYTPQQIQRAFDYSGAYSSGFDGTGINVAIVGTGPISAADYAAYQQMFGNVRMGHVTQVDVTDEGVAAGLAANSPSPSPLPSGATFPTITTGFQTPPPVTAPCGGFLPNCNPEDYEAQLDTESIAALAPGSNVLFYLGYNTTGGPFGTLPGEGIYFTDAEIQQIIADDTADVVSMSFGEGEPLGAAGGALATSGPYTTQGVGYGPTEMAAMVSEGMALFGASGDNGAYNCGVLTPIIGNMPCVSWPGGDPSVVSVGGVSAPLNDDGTLQTQFTAWGDQTTGGGNGSFGNNIGSGGGISSVFLAPSWQQAAGVTALTNGMRGQPDLSLLGDPATGATIVANAAFGLQSIQIGGTSMAAPQMSAMWALVLQACKADAACSAKGSGTHPYRLGNPNPLFYAIYANAANYAKTFTDVTYGSNGASPEPSTPGYQARTGYDLVTGIGVPHAGHLIDAILTAEGVANPPALP